MQLQAFYMKNLFFLFAAASLVFMSCGNQEKGQSASRVLSDSLFKEVIDLHNVGMAKMSRLAKSREEAAHRIDSLQKLPAAAKSAAAPYAGQLDSLSKQLANAESLMQAWMTGFNVDSANNGTDQWIQYLRDEREKVTSVKDLILTSLQSADSLLKK